MPIPYRDANEVANEKQTTSSASAKGNLLQMKRAQATQRDILLAEHALLTLCAELGVELDELAESVPEYQAKHWSDRTAELNAAVLRVAKTRIEREPSSAELWEISGTALAQLGRVDEAFSELRAGCGN